MANASCYNCTSDHSDGSNFNRIVPPVVVALFTLTTVVGLFGNVLVLLVIFFNKKMRNSTNYLVLNLALVDLIFVIVVVPFTAVKYTTPIWIFGDIWCRIVNYTSFVCAWASVYTLVLMSLDRVLAIVFAVRCRNLRTKQNSVISIVIVWVVVGLANIPAWIFHGQLTYDFHGAEERITCVFLTEQVSEGSRLAFHFSYFVFGFMLPIIAITVLYGILIAFLLGRTSLGSGSSAVAQTKKRVTIMVVIVVVVFIVCWLPIHIILVLNHMKRSPPRSTTFVALSIASNCLAYMHSCMNPLLYTISSSVFRQAFKEFLSCKTSQLKCLLRSGDTNNRTPPTTDTALTVDREERLSIMDTVINLR